MSASADGRTAPIARRNASCAAHVDVDRTGPLVEDRGGRGAAGSSTANVRGRTSHVAVAVDAAVHDDDNVDADVRRRLPIHQKFLRMVEGRNAWTSDR